MEILYAFVFLIGTCVGSFLNAYLFRFRTGYSILSRSQCPACGHTLTWYELIPLVSFLIQKGQCRACGGRISLQYPLVELLAGLVGVGTVLMFGMTLEALLAALVFWLGILISVYDIKHTIIPNEWVLLLFALSLFLLFVTGSQLVFTLPWQRLLASAAVFVFFWGLWYYTGGKSMGLGDAKLAAALTPLLAPAAAVSAVITSFWVGAGYSLAQIGYQKLTGEGDMGMKTAIPFGPFIIIGFVIVFVSGIRLF